MRKLLIILLALVIVGCLVRIAAAFNIGAAQTGGTNIGVMQKDPSGAVTLYPQFLNGSFFLNGEVKIP